MTQEDKNLLLKDICARLPYGVKVEYENKIFDIDYISSYQEIKLDEYTINYTIDISEVKPYLLPLESMTEEQIKEALSTKHKINLPSGKFMYLDSLKTFEFYNKNHIDYLGLIPQGLAKDATNFNIY